MIRKGENKGDLESRSDKEGYPCVQVSVFVSAHVFFMCQSAWWSSSYRYRQLSDTTRTHAHTRMHARSRVKQVEKTLGIWLLSGTRMQKTEKKAEKKEKQKKRGHKTQPTLGFNRA